MNAPLRKSSCDKKKLRHEQEEAEHQRQEALRLAALKKEQTEAQQRILQKQHIKEDARIQVAAHLADLLNDTLAAKQSLRHNIYEACKNYINHCKNLDNLVQLFNVKDASHEKDELASVLSEILHDLIIYGSLAYTSMKMMHAIGQISSEHTPYTSLHHWIINRMCAYEYRNYIMHNLDIVRDEDISQQPKDQYLLQTSIMNLETICKKLHRDLYEPLINLRRTGSLEQYNQPVDLSYLTDFYAQKPYDKDESICLKGIYNCSMILQQLAEIAAIIKAKAIDVYLAAGTLQAAMQFYNCKIGEYLSYDCMAKHKQILLGLLPASLLSHDKDLTIFEEDRIAIAHYFSYGDTDRTNKEGNIDLTPRKPVPRYQESAIAPFQERGALQLLEIAKAAKSMEDYCAQQLLPPSSKKKGSQKKYSDLTQQWKPKATPPAKTEDSTEIAHSISYQQAPHDIDALTYDRR